MDNASKWWDTQTEAEARRKFGETEKQRENGKRQRTITAIIGSFSIVCLVIVIYEIARRTH